VGAVYTIDPFVRSAEEVIEADLNNLVVCDARRRVFARDVRSSVGRIAEAGGLRL
jgi:hypothetical protein